MNYAFIIAYVDTLKEKYQNGPPECSGACTRTSKMSPGWLLASKVCITSRARLVRMSRNIFRVNATSVAIIEKTETEAARKSLYNKKNDLEKNDLKDHTTLRLRGF